MKKARITWPIVFAFLLAGAPVILAQPAAQGTVPTSIVVSVEAKHGKEIPNVYRQDVRVMQGHDRLQVTNWTPCQSEQTGAELFVLVDDATDPELGLQFDDLKKFMQAQPANTAIGVGYARNGTVQIAQNLTKDRALVAKALHLPIGAGAAASPYLSVTDLVKGWPQSGNCREIMMISSGIDFLQGGPDDTYLLSAIEDAQRAGIQVYAIYAEAIGHARHSFFRSTWGQNNLARLTEETGGEFYIQGFHTPIAFAPYLGQYADRLKRQYELTFLAKGGNKGELRHVTVDTEVTNAELVAQDQVWIPAAK